MSDVTITERRAIFVYEAARLAAQAAHAPIVPLPWEKREDAFRVQFLGVMERQCGPQRSTSPEELHGSWMQAYLAMGWVYGERYDREKRVHPDLVPYAQLGQLERDKDAVFVALCEIARQWIYDEDPDLSDPTAKAKDLLARATARVRTVDDEGNWRDACEIGRESLAGRAAQLTIGRLAPDLLRVAIGLAEALAIRHNANPLRAGMEGSIRQAHHDECQGCIALAAWGALLERMPDE